MYGQKDFASVFVAPTMVDISRFKNWCVYWSIWTNRTSSNYCETWACFRSLLSYNFMATLSLSNSANFDNMLNRRMLYWNFLTCSIFFYMYFLIYSWPPWDVCYTGTLYCIYFFLNILEFVSILILKTSFLYLTPNINIAYQPFKTLPMPKSVNSIQFVKLTLYVPFARLHYIVM